MIPYIIRSVLCGAALLLLYKGLLQGEKFYRFNRFYLLFSMLAMLVIPLVKINIAERLPEPVLPAVQYISASETVVVSMASANDTAYVISAWQIIYLLVTLSLLVRFIRNLTSILTQAKQLEKATYKNISVSLLPDGSGNYTFLDHIFISHSDYETHIQEPRIIDHEMVHARQKHSLDILFAELLLIFFWFNPLLLIYKKAIQLNHEFLADDAVKGNGDESLSYQYLVIAKAGAHSSVKNISITSGFHYAATKKRLIMMNRNSPLRKRMFKIMLLLPSLAIVITGITADAPVKLLPGNAATAAQSPRPGSGAPQSLLDEMLKICNSYMAQGKAKGGLSRVTAEDRKKLETIFFQMSGEQQKTAPVQFLPPLGPPEKTVPTAEQFTKWKDGTAYGIWIDGRKVNNEVLASYAPSDFSHYSASRLLGAAKKNKPYSVQLDLMTNAYYADYCQKRLNDKNNVMIFSFPRSEKKGTGAE